MEWHRALGHLNFTDLRRIMKKLGVVSNEETPECKTCLLAKMTRTSFSDKDIKSTQPLQLIHTDLSGIIRSPACHNYNYFLTFTDDMSRYTTVYLLKSKDEVHQKFTKYKALVENQFGTTIKKVRSDNGTEYTCGRFQEVIKTAGIDHCFTNTNTPEQNGVSERLNRTIANGVRCELIESKLPTRLWPYAVEYVVQTRNASPHAKLNFKIPYEMWHGRTPEYEMYHPFGCTAIAYNADAEGKWEPRGLDCRFLMLSRQKKGYTLLNVESNQIMESCHVKFMKNDTTRNLSDNSGDHDVIFFDCDELSTENQTNEAMTPNLFLELPNETHICYRK